MRTANLLDWANGITKEAGGAKTLSKIKSLVSDTHYNPEGLLAGLLYPQRGTVKNMDALVNTLASTENGMQRVYNWAARKAKAGKMSPEGFEKVKQALLGRADDVVATTFDTARPSQLSTALRARLPDSKIFGNGPLVNGTANSIKALIGEFV